VEKEEENNEQSKFLTTYSSSNSRMDSSTINSKACGKLHVFAVKYRIAEYSIAFIVLVGSLLFSFTPVHQRKCLSTKYTYM
jgi:hypothetical protein